MCVWRGRFEERKQRQDGGNAAGMGGLTRPSRAMTDAKWRAVNAGPTGAALPSTPRSIGR